MPTVISIGGDSCLSDFVIRGPASGRLEHDVLLDSAA